MIHRGGCHCGNLRYALETQLALEQLPLRACQCSFCRLHGARSTSDPAGRLRFEVRDAGKLMRYRFGLKTADFLICAGCGVYVGALMREGGSSWAIVNGNTLDEVAKLTQDLVPMDYDGENEVRRLALVAGGGVTLTSDRCVAPCRARSRLERSDGKAWWLR